jgi:hypothetical protein
MLQQFPFEIRGFHSDNGSEFINHTVAELLGKLLIDRWIARHATSRLPSLSAGEPYIVLSCRSGKSRPNARTASKFTAVFRIRDHQL